MSCIPDVTLHVAGILQCCLALLIGLIHGIEDDIDEITFKLVRHLGATIKPPLSTDGGFTQFIQLLGIFGRGLFVQRPHRIIGSRWRLHIIRCRRGIEKLSQVIPA